MLHLANSDHLSLRRRFRVAVLVAAASLAGTAVTAHAAAASTTTPVSGAFTVTDFGTTTCATDGAPFILRCETTGYTIQYSGSLNGTSSASFRQVVNCRTGDVVASGTETFTGSVAGVGTGSLTWRKTGGARLDCTTGELTDFSGRGDITAGTGGLAGVNGSLVFGPDVYSGAVH